jgi:hypothetical protein
VVVASDADGVLQWDLVCYLPCVKCPHQHHKTVHFREAVKAEAVEDHRYMECTIHADAPFTPVSKGTLKRCMLSNVEAAGDGCSQYHFRYENVETDLGAFDVEVEVEKVDGVVKDKGAVKARKKEGGANG